MTTKAADIEEGLAFTPKFDAVCEVTVKPFVGSQALTVPPAPFGNPGTLTLQTVEMSRLMSATNFSLAMVGCAA